MKRNYRQRLAAARRFEIETHQWYRLMREYLWLLQK